MKRNFDNFLVALLLAALGFSLMTPTPAQAAAYTASVSGNWSDTATWGGAGVPGSTGEGDTVVINTGITVTLDASPAYSIASLTLTAPASNNALNWSTNETLTVTGAVTMNAPSAGTVTSTIAVGAGTLTAGSIAIPGSATAGRFCTVSVSTGTINVTGSVAFSGTVAQARLIFSGAGRLNVSGNFTNGGTLTTSGNGTINFNGGVAQIAGTYTTYNKVEINNTSGGVSINGTTTFGGTLAVNAGTFTVGAFTLTVTGATSISGTLTISSTTGTKTFGDITINDGGTMSFTAAESVTINGNLQNDGTISGTTGTWTFQKAGGGGTISGSSSTTVAAATFTTAYTNSGNFTVTGTLTVTGVTLTNDSTVTATGALSGSGAGGTAVFVNSATGTVNIGGTSNITTLTATASGNTVKYTGAAQTIKAATYHHLTTSGSGTKTLGGNVIVNGDLTVGSGTTLNLSTFTADRADSGGTITVAGTLQIGGANSFPGNYTTHTLTGGTVQYTGTSAQTVSAETYNNLSTSGNFTKTLAGPTTVNTNLTIGANTALDVSGSNFALSVGGNWTNSGTFTPQNGTVILNGSGAQTIGATTFYHLTTDTGGTKTLSGNVIVGGNITIGSGTGFTIGAFTSNVTGATSISGTLTISSTTGTKTFGDITINNGGTMSFTAAESVTINGNLQNDGVISGTTGTWTFQKSGSSGTISGSNSITVVTATFTTGNYTNSGNLTVTGTLTVTGVTLTNDNIITATGALSGTGALTNSAAGTMNIGGTSTITTLMTTASGNTVKYTGAAQTARVQTYSNLTVSGSGAKTFATTPTVNGILSMEGTATITVTTGVVTYGANATLQYNTTTARTSSAEEWITPFAATGGVIIANTGNITLNVAKVFNASVPLTINGGATLDASSFQLTIGGDFINNGTFTAGTGTVVYNGAEQTIASATYNNLTVSQSSGDATLGGDATVNGVLTLTSGKITTGINTLIISSTGSISGGSSSRYVIGNLQKYVTTGATSRTFEVGTAGSYDPVTVAFGSVSVAGDLTAKVTSGEHANIGSSVINPSKDVNGYWSLTNSGITFDTYSVTFTFASGDVDGSANTSAFFVGRYDSGWTYPTVGTRTSTSTQATGLTSFSDFVMGEIAITWVSYNDDARTVADDNFTAGENMVYMFGENFLISHTYAVGYYDGRVTGGGQKVATDSGLLSGTSGNLTSQYLLTTDFGAVPGTWHSVVFDTGLGSPTTNYTDAVGSSGYVVEHTFDVAPEAIPEFPTVIAAIVVAGSCFGLYFWMRRHRLDISQPTPETVNS